MRAEILPGILAHTLEDYIARLEIVESSSATWAHIDIADGQFVPNITVMPHEFMGIPTKLSLEAHLMTFSPERYYSDLVVAGVTRVLLHRESFTNFEDTAKAIHDAANYFAEVGLVLSPGTVIESYESLSLAVIMCMGVHPGFSGQPFVEEAYGTIKGVVAQKLKAVVAVDGGVSEDNIRQLQKEGVNRFVISSQLFATNAMTTNLHHFIQLLAQQGGV